MKNKADYSKYECPYSHLEKEIGHELHGPEGYQDVYNVWCACGFRAPVFYLDPDELGLKLKKGTDVATEAKQCNIAIVSGSYYWVKLMSDDKHEPAIAINLRGVMNFQFFNGVVVPCDKVNDYSECNYR